MDFQHLTDRKHLSGIDAKSAKAGNDTDRPITLSNYNLATRGLSVGIFEL